MRRIKAKHETIDLHPILVGIQKSNRLIHINHKGDRHQMAFIPRIKHSNKNKSLLKLLKNSMLRKFQLMLTLVKPMVLKVN
jgi:hypothetical protein